MPNPENRKRYAMRVEEITKQGRKWIDVDEAGASIGLSSHESRAMADYLSDRGWVTTMQFGEGGPVRLRLVDRGFDEIAKLRWSKPRRWLDVNRGFVFSLIGGLVAILAREIIKWLFGV